MTSEDVPDTLECMISSLGSISHLSSKSSKTSVLASTTFYRWESEASGRLSDLSKVIQLEMEELEFKPNQVTVL